MATQLFQPPYGSPAWFYATVDAVRVTDEVRSERVTLTPALAGELLKQNPTNRLMKDAKYNQLLSDLRSGRWMFNGEPILISKEGLLNDGQHRCNAVIETNTNIDTMLTFGLDRSSRVTVDQGAAKTAADYMQMDGIENATHVAAITRLLLAYEGTGGIAVGSSSRISSGEIRQRVLDDPLLARAATFSTSTNRYARRFAQPAVVGFAHYLFSRINKDDADLYMMQVCRGESLKKNDPAFAVREGLLRDRVTRSERVHLIFRGWNAFRNKRPLTLAKVAGNLPALI